MGSVPGGPLCAAIDQVGQLRGDARGYGWPLLLNGHRQHDGHRDHVMEGDFVHGHLVQDHSKAVHVGRELVSHVDEDLGCSPVNCAHVSCCVCVCVCVCCW